MINGFVLEIWNRSSETEELLLFKDESKRSELEVTVLHASYSFESLILMAQTQGFMGSGVQCDPYFIQEMVVHTEQGTQEVSFDTRWDGPIQLDGGSNYIALKIPPSSNGYFQLLPVV